MKISNFIKSVFDRLKEQKSEIFFGVSEAMFNSRPEDLRKAFNRMNG